MTKKIKIAAGLIWLISTAFIIVGSLSTHIRVPDEHNIDKFIHGGAYAGLAFLSFFFINRPKYIALALITLIVMGGGIEIMQNFLPPRSGTIGDFIADSVGVLVGSLIAMKLKPVILDWLKKC